jgi:hypothetical protein
VFIIQKLNNEEMKTGNDPTLEDLTKAFNKKLEERKHFRV